MRKIVAELYAELTFPRRKAAEAIVEAVRPESSLRRLQRSRVSVECRQNVVAIKIEAQDFTAMRAAFNAYLRYINTWWLLASFLR